MGVVVQSSTSGGHALEAAAIEQLRAGVRGEVLCADDAGFDAARTVWNGMIDRVPAVIVRCCGVADVLRGLEVARSSGLPVSVRGGGHQIAGHAIADGGLVMDLSRMKGMRVDPARCVAQAQPGVTWGEFDRETQAFGLATTGGLVSTTGIAGLTLGGGIGWLMRQHGLTCDNLLSADVVTADGRLLRASATENTDLFWGLRGGGGNFGIVTSFEYQLHPLSQVLAGLVLHPAAQGREVLQFVRDYVATVPDELTLLVAFITAPPAPFLPAHLHGTPVVAIAVCYAGAIEGGEAAVRPLRTFGPPLVDLIHPMPYPLLQSMFDASAPPGLQNYWKSDYLRELSDGAIDIIVSHAAAMASPLSQVHLHQIQGQVSRVGEQDTAYGHRDAPFLLNILAAWPDPRASKGHISWVREFWTALQPFSAGGTYVNFLGDEGENRVHAAYPASYARLAALKDAYDPTNLFRFNQNIAPSATFSKGE